ncbi:MAG: cytochrome b/b6 domain-containing protein [Desulfobulbus sp.]|nr:cytochrome b/b6 domain-containing protein [Desulfobulbus sp.]
MSHERIYIYKRYERFWHWSQALLIICMMITGFEIHGVYSLLGFERAVHWHSTFAWILFTLWVFTLFWQITTGEWRQYRPSLKNVDSMVWYYAVGIFTHSPNPFRKTATQKHNPLQRLAYLVVLVFMLPLIWITGVLYLFYGDWGQLGIAQFLSLKWVAILHLFAAYLIATFFFVHVYLTTAGHTVFAHIKGMITGWEEDETKVAAAPKAP